MAKTRSRDANFSIGGTAMECFIRNIAQNIDQPEVDITTICDAGPRSLVDNYRHGYDLDGFADFDSGASDSVLFGLVGDEDGAATIFQPTGAGAGANDPNYTSSAILSTYNITASVGGVVSYRATLRGSAALVRAVA